MNPATHDPAETSAWEWRYALPASDRFFNPIPQDEDLPVDGHEDRRSADLVTCTSSAGIEATVTAAREPMPDGTAQANPARIRYTRILPLQLQADAQAPGDVDLHLQSPVSLDRADRLQLWFFADANLTAAGASLWACTNHGAILLDGDAAGRRWRLCEATLEPHADLRIEGVRLRLAQPCRATCWMDALRVGRYRGFRPFDEPCLETGQMDVEPASLARGTAQPVRIAYTAQTAFAAGNRFTLDSPVGWRYRNQPGKDCIQVSILHQRPDGTEQPLAVVCRTCPHVRWRSEASTILAEPLHAGSRLIWVLDAVDSNAGDNPRCDNRSFRLYVQNHADARPRRHAVRATLCFSDPVPRKPVPPSRPAAVQREARDGLRPWFGYLHAHSDISEDGRQSPAACYRYGRDVAQLDFCALSDHFWAHEPAWKWDCIQQTAADFYRAGNFVTFAAYEWSSQDHGDRNVYFEQEGPPCPVGPIESTPEELYAHLEGQRAIIIPHSPAFETRARGINWDVHHPGLERLVEVYSAHGSSEGPQGNPFPLRNTAMGPEFPGNGVRAALTRGLRLGMIAGGDDHIRPADPGRPTGMAGVWAEALTREAIFEALYQRRCFGATAPGLSLEFRVNAHWMGAEVLLPERNTTRHYRVRLSSERPLQRVEWIRNGVCRRVWYAEAENRREMQVEWTDTSRLHPAEHSYVRVFCADGHMAWSSPVFLRARDDSRITPE